MHAYVVPLVRVTSVHNVPFKDDGLSRRNPHRPQAATVFDSKPGSGFHGKEDAQGQDAARLPQQID